MKQQDIAKIYARSVLELAESKNVDITSELHLIQDLIMSHNQLENLLYLDIFSIEEKKDVMEKILSQIKLSEMTNNFIRYLIQEKRFSLFSFIFKEITVLDDFKKGFLKVEIEGPFEKIPEEDLKVLEKYLTGQLTKKPKFVYHKKENLVAGYRIKAGDLYLDATVRTQLENLKQMIIGE